MRRVVSFCRRYSYYFVELTKFFAFYYVLLVIGFEFDLHLDLDLHLIDVCLKSDEYNALYDFKLKNPLGTLN